MAENETLVVPVNASDPDGDPITLSLDGPAFATLTDASDGTGTIELAPGAGDAGEYTLNVTASDGNLTAEESFTLTVTENDTSSDAPAGDGDSNSSSSGSGLVTDGLALHLEADAGVSTDGSGVTSWTDQSGNGNDLTASGNPTLEAGATPAAQSAIAFDGSDDVLERTGTTGLPTGSGDRTMFVVAQYESTGFGGATYGDDQSNEAFGLAVDDGGDLTVQGWGTGNDFSSGVAGTGAGWLTQSVVLSNDDFTHYRDGSAIDSGTHAFATASDRIVVGAEMTPPPYLNMDVAAVLVYDRALTDTERQQVEGYLQEKYIEGTGGEPANQAPSVSPIADQTMVENETRTLDVTASDPDGDALVLSLIEAPSFASLDDHGNGTAHLELAPGAGDAGEYPVTVEASDGNLTDSESFTLTVTDGGSGSGPPTANDDSATVTPNGSVDIEVLANDADPDGDINASSVVVTSGPANGTTAVGATGIVTYAHDGSSATSDSFTYTVADLAGNRSDEATVSITVDSEDDGGDDGDDGSGGSGSSSSGGGGSGGGGGGGSSGPSVDVSLTTGSQIRAQVTGARRVVPLTIHLPSMEDDGTGTELTVIRVTPGGARDFELLIDRDDAPASGTPGLRGQAGLAYFTIDHELTDSDVANARLTFRVSKARLDAWGVDPTTVTIYRYEDGSWASYGTDQVREDAGAYYFSATFPGLSQFAVGGDRTIADGGSTTEDAGEATPGDSGEPTAGGEQTPTSSPTESSPTVSEPGGLDLQPALIVIALLAFLVIVGFAVFNYRR